MMETKLKIAKAEMGIELIRQSGLNHIFVVTDGKEFCPVGFVGDGPDILASISVVIECFFRGQMEKGMSVEESKFLLNMTYRAIKTNLETNVDGDKNEVN